MQTLVRHWTSNISLTIKINNDNESNFPTVSMMAAQEFDGMKEQLDLEQSLRVKAETYAHEVKKSASIPNSFQSRGCEEPETLEEQF